MRNSKGQFIRGHKAINPRDKATGRFLKKSIEEEVDNFLKELKEKNERYSTE